MPDRYTCEPMPDGSIASFWWMGSDGKYHDHPPDAEDGPGTSFGEPLTGAE